MSIGSGAKAWGSCVHVGIVYIAQLLSLRRTLAISVLVHVIAGEAKGYKSMKIDCMDHVDRHFEEKYQEAREPLMGACGTQCRYRPAL